jgi:uncharacterized damage-inducible protein DinB
MLQKDAILLFEHVFWVRDRLLDAADDPSIDWRSRDAVTIRGLRATLVHELDVEWSWRERLRGPDPTTFGSEPELDPADYPTVPSLREHWERDAQEMRSWLATLTDDRLEERCRAEPDAEHPFWFHMQHLYTHAMQQFSEAGVLLTQAGRSPGEIDFLGYVEDRGVVA